VSMPSTFTFKGIDNIHDPAALPEGFLTSAMNFNLLDTGKCRTREGRSLVSAVDYHSLFAAAERMVGCHAGVLYDLSASTPTALFNFAADAPLVYQQIPNASIVISNGSEIVYMVGNSVHRFADPPVFESLGDVDVPTGFLPMPGCYQMAWLDANLYMAVVEGNETFIYYTDAWDFSGVHRESFYRVPGLLRMMAATEDTLWVSDDTAIHSVNAGVMVKRLDYPAIRKGFTATSGEKCPVSGLVGTVIIVSTEQGVVALGNTALFKNISLSTTTLPVAESAASGMIEQDGQVYYITSLSGIDNTTNKYNPAAITVEIY
jgi:hypothetical protein